MTQVSRAWLYWPLFVLFPFLTYSQDCSLPRLAAEFSLLNNDICEGRVISIRNTTNENGHTGVWYIMDWGDGTRDTILTKQDITHIYDLTQFDACAQEDQKMDLRLFAMVKTVGCDKNHDVQKPVFIKFQPRPIIDGPEKLCLPGADAQFMASGCPRAGNTLSWNFNDPASGGNNTSSDPNPMHTFSGAGKYLVSLTSTNTCGSRTITENVDVFEGPVVSAKINVTNVCEGVPVQLSSDTRNVSDFRWRISGNVRYINNTTNTSPNPTVVFTGNGKFDITLEGEGCGMAKWDTSITIIAPPEVALADVAGSCSTIKIVPGDLVRYTGGVPTTTTWTFLNQIPGTSSNPTPNDTLTYSNQGDYSILLRATNGCGQDSDTVSFSINSILAAKLANVPTTFCTGQAAFTPQLQPLGGSLFLNGNPLNAGTAIAENDLVNGLNTVVYTFGQGLCKTVDTVRINKTSAPNVQLKNLPSLCRPAQINLDTVVTYSGGDATAYNWRFIGFSVASSSDKIPTSNLVITRQGRYTIANTSSNACGVDSASISFSFDTLVTLRLPSVQPLCNSASPFTLVANAPNGQWSGTGITPQGVFVPEQAAIGVNTLTYSVGSGSCLVADSVQIIVRGQLIDAGRDTSVCANSDVFTLMGSTPGIWQGIGIENPSGVFNAAVAGVGKHTVTLTVRETSSGCINVDSVQVSVLGLPSGVLGVSPTTCRNAPIQFTVDGQNLSTINWNFGDGSTSQGTPVSHTFANSGTYAVQVSIGAGGCLDTLLQDVRVLEPVTANIVARDTVGCSPFSAIVRNNSIGDDATYRWFLNDSLIHEGIIYDSLILRAANANRQYNIRLESSNTCKTDTTSVRFMVNAPASAFFNASFSQFCSGDTVRFAHQSFADTLLWNFGNGFTYGGNTPPPQIYKTGTQNDTIQVRLIALNSCNADTLIRSLVISPTKSKAFFNIPKRVVCVGEEVEYVSFSQPIDGRHVWDFGDEGVLTGPSVTHAFTKPGMKTIRLRVTSCGVDEIEQTLEVKPLPGATWVHPPLACLGDTVRLEIKGQGSGQMWFGDSDSLAAKTALHEYAEPGTYDLRGVITSEFGCPGEVASSKIVIRPLPEPIITTPDTICQDGSAILLHNIASRFCQWEVEGNRFDRCQIQYTFKVPGIVPIALQVRDTFGCVNSGLSQVFVRPRPTAVFRLRQDGFCPPVESVFTNQSTQATGYYWSFGNGAFETKTNPTHTFTEPGIYNVSLIASYEGVCFDTTAQSVTVSSTPAVTLEVDDERCRAGDQAVISVRNAQSTDVINWYLNNSLVQDGRSRLETSTVGNYTVLLTNTFGCDTMLAFTLLERQGLVNEIMPDTAILLGTSVRIRTLLNDANAKITWSPQETLDDPTAAEPIATPLLTTMYYLNAENEFCTVRDSIIITVIQEKGIFFPNAFSPFTEDGNNDAYEIFPTKGVKRINRFQVFNSWGTQVFEANDFLPPGNYPKWDGTYQGKPLNPDVFVFQAQITYVDGTQGMEHGTIHLIR